MRTIRIGKSSSNDYVISNPTVSRSHAVITVDADGQHATVKDLNSTNGTFINNNNKRITSDVRVSSTDIIRFGSERTTLAEILSKANKTVIRNSTPNNLPGIDRRTIGKSPDNQIVLTYDDVSRKHAMLYKDVSGNVVIEDLNSTNGTYVNGIKVTSKILQAGDKVTITRNYPLNWETIFSPSVKKPEQRNGNTKKPLIIAAAVLACAILIGGAAFILPNFLKWDKEKVYKEYHTAVCWIYVRYGYQVMVDGENFTPILCQALEVKPSDIVSLDDDKLVPEAKASQGTGFFISNSGMIATNLHISRPWLFSDDSKKLEDVTNKILAYLSASNPTFARSKVEVKCNVISMLVIPDGLPIDDANATSCQEIKGYDEVDKDVAILQTTTRKLPADVTNIIDINNADPSPESIVEGKTVFTIGFPYGADVALTSSQELKNQVHGGSVTQDRGEYEFGHDAETAGGASGSPIINDRGRLIGVHHAGFTGVTGAQGFNRAIKVKYLLDLLK